jgi:U3 small nucleolar RNA-associated protein 12
LWEGEVLCLDLQGFRRYGDGSIRIWDSRIATVVISFNGHKSAITTLAFDKDGVRLASGSKDTDIIVWDLVAETGLFKLRGHKDQVTGLHYIHTGGGLSTADVETNGDDSLTNGLSNSDSQDAGYLLSTSKDALIKIWDIGSQHCMETHVAQSNGECWSMGVSADQSGVITAGNDGELKVWSNDLVGLARAAKEVSGVTHKGFLRERGILYRQGKDRTIGVHFHPKGTYIAAHGSDRSVDLWKIRSESEVQKTMARKRKRRKEKALAGAGQDGKVNGDLIDGKKDIEDLSSAHITDVIVPYVIVRTTGKLRSMAWASRRAEKSFRLLLATTNNQLELYDVTMKQKDRISKSDEPPDYTRSFSVDTPGHRTDVRSLALSSDDRMLASACNGSLKIWNVRTQSCIRTLDCGYALCATFLPGDKIVVVGNRNGELELYDIASSTLIDTVKAHEGPIWTLHVHPDGRSMATGSADKSAKFYGFEVIQEEIPGTKRTTPRFKLAHTRTLKISDDILSLRFSPDSRLIALSLLDNTVKVFFVDSLKLFLNLYGHKLPVLSMDISYDSKLIVTCSADKNVRLWGLDFGDCHKAFFAHQDSIMHVAFVPHNQDGNGHHFFSASKDRLIKYWDGDKFEQIQKLQGHHGEIWALAVSRKGEFLVSASHDKSIRVWDQTDEQIFLEEEREKELEELYENTLTTSLEQDEGQSEEKSEAVDAGKQTVETLMAGEKIAEALETGMVDLEVVKEYHEAKASQPNLAQPSRDPIYLAYNNISAEAHLLNVIQKIKAAALQDALLVLPFDKVTALFIFLRIWAERQWNMPLTCRILFFMLKTHHKQIVASKAMRTTLDEIRDRLRGALQAQKDEIGFNLAALRFVGKRMGEMASKQYVDEKIWDEEEEAVGKRKKKRGFIDMA